MVTWAIAENNPGALAFMMDAYGFQPSSKSDPFRAEQAFGRMKYHCITGVDLYILWNDCCGRDTAKAIKIMCEKEIGEIRKHLNHGKNGIPFEDEKDLPSAEPDVPDRNAGDLISRQAAIEALWKALYEYEDKTEKQFQESDELDISEWILHRIFVQNMSDIDRKAILDLPSAQPDVPERNVGKWIKVGDNSYMCSVCGEVSCCNGNFCPDCGADMRERRTDELGITN